ncbi:hypothetical protein ES332_A10G268100v1 [Gossypium tomentosum]|uniref:ADP-ribosyl cyclase/cyclic ADP-ribose hydrolase n=1 Tax=Gossypium tomentosum TaxID=34277 RepID=A0A5D2NWU5_GOSTO|nr:hypothetical protein ES332_A10G268100v1 [Gossypium tomentosum]
MFSSMKKNWKGGTSFHKHFLEQLQSQISQSSFCLQTMPLRNHAWLNSLTSWTAIAPKKQIVLPIFYHVNPSDVENLGGSFKTSFDQHEATRSVDELVKRWKTAFAEVGKLKGWHIDGSISDRPETQYIKDIVVYVMQNLMKHQVFLSLGEDTRLNFSNHLVNYLENVGINVFPHNETLGKGEKLPPIYSRAISASNLSILILSKDYASSISCLVELSSIMDRKRESTDKHIVLPIFYHVDPSDVRHIGGSFKTSFKKHELEQPADRVIQWRTAFAEV